MESANPVESAYQILRIRTRHDLDQLRVSIGRAKWCFSGQCASYWNTGRVLFDALGARLRQCPAFTKKVDPMKHLIMVLSVFVATTVHAQTEVPPGDVGGTWTQANSPYHIVGDINVLDLIIEPGVQVVFHGEYAVTIPGRLRAIGTAIDSICFTKADTLSTGWRGILFDRTALESELAYCKIEQSHAWGIYIDQSFPVIRHSEIKNNENKGVITNSDLTLVSCKVDSNRTGGRLGGGISSTAHLTLIDCSVSGNSLVYLGSASTAAGGGIYSSGGLTLANVVIDGNHARSTNSNAGRGAAAVGGGLYSSGGRLEMRNCIIRNNAVTANANTAAEIVRGGGAYVTGADSTHSVTNVLFYKNVLNSRLVWSGSDLTGGGLHVAGGNLIVTNCTFYQNDFEALHRSGGTAVVRNSILWENTSSTRPSEIVGTVTCTYSDVEGGHGDPVDQNFSANPIFDSCLRVQLPSVCYDAGDPSPEFNDSDCTGPDDTVRNDVGAHGGPRDGDWGSLTELVPCYDCYSTSVTLDALTAVQVGSDVLVSWRTSQEVDVAGFRIFRAFEGGLFHPVGERIAPSSSRFYTFRDVSPPDGELMYRIGEVSPDGDVTMHGVAKVVVSRAASRMALYPNSPNPFNPRTTIKYSLSENGPVTLSVLDVRGRTVRSLLRNSYLSAGQHSKEWDGLDQRGREASAGVYIVRLVTVNRALTRRMLLIK